MRQNTLGWHQALQALILKQIDRITNLHNNTLNPVYYDIKQTKNIFTMSGEWYENNNQSF